MQKPQRRKSRGISQPEPTKQEHSFLWKDLVYLGTALVSSVALAVLLRAVPSIVESDDPIPNANAASKTNLVTSLTSVAKKPPLQLPDQERSYDTKIEKDDLLARLEQALNASKQKAALHFITALTYSEFVQTEKAQTHFRESLKLDPNNTLVIAEYAKQLIQVGKHSEAIDLLTEPVKAGTIETRLHAELGNAYLQAGELQSASDILEKAVDLFPKNGPILMRLAQAEVQRGNFQSAEKNARAAMSVGENSDAVYMTLSTALIRLGQREKAMEVRSEQSKIPKPEGDQDAIYKRSFRQFAGHTYGMLANVLASDGDARNAEKWYLYGLQLDPKSVRNLVGLSALVRKAGRTRDSLTVYKRLVELEPGNAVHFNNLASLAVSLQDQPVADQALRRLLILDPSGNADLVYANFCLQNRDSKRSAKHAKIASVKTQNPDAFHLWITALQLDGRMAEALAALNQARVQFPTDSRFHPPQLR